MRILIVGLGSIGKRHAACLEEMQDIEIAVLRTARGTLKEPGPYKEFYKLEDALAFNPDGVIIANPTSLHIASALPFLQRGIKTLIEKPIAHTASETSLLEPYKDNIRVAYCLRFLSLSAHIKEIIEKEQLIKLSFKRSYYLPKWHPYADYRTEYTAKKELGGGVIRTLSHEIDLMLYWLGKPVSTTGVIDKISALEIDTDDFAFFTCKTARGARVNFELDFLSPVNINSAELFTDKGKYYWDTSSLNFIAYDASTPVELYGAAVFDFGNMYKEQVKDFIQFIQTGHSRNCDFRTAVDVIHLIEGLEKHI